MVSSEMHWDGEDNPIVLVFAHGAGAGPQSEFMHSMAAKLAHQGLAVLRFEFPYWTQVRETGRKRPPNKQDVLQQAMQDVVSKAANGTAQGKPLWLMGKSMGARVAFQSYDPLHRAGFNVKGCVGLGFPFHPPGKQDKTRTHELINGAAKNLVIHGSKDPFGKQSWVESQSLAAQLMVEWVAGGNHDLVPNKSTGISANESWQQVAERVARFIKEHS
ncbi:alpha/beta hydrolase [Aliidiomarina sedimenti]|uniref:Alpha/beta hydrolase n=1 Tax=Aliidiomarina sedimenti TaxID=1933879 RepID=A0ABY0C2S5_9GAMM|nr:alpha/beta fold hydrolase [Aliidiomarina sedimenti]RUO32060.1 alpha/beta hydrolase [Aliidiomarina sedimenti]